MSRILIGPFVGEFGWELMHWQGYARTVATENSYDEVIVIARESSEFLYRDFYTKFISHGITGATDCDLCNGRNYNILLDKYKQPGDVLFPSKRFLPDREPDITEWPFSRQTFIKFGTKIKDEYDILIHARNTDKCNSKYRNWPDDKWIKLHNLLVKNYSIGYIGINDDRVFGENNLKDIPLDRLSNIMAGSRLYIGTSSGPAHFASLCGLPHIILSPSCNIGRYGSDWNPFNTPNKVTCINDWNPPVDLVYNLTTHYLKNNNFDI